jgi:lipopolysaccharide transport system permease protein
MSTEQFCPAAGPAAGGGGVTATSLTSRLFLLRELVRRDFQGRYAGSLLGFLWSFVQPLWQLLLFCFVFSTVMRISPLGERTGRFWVFLFCGLLPWMAVQEGVLRGASAITDNANLVKKLQFPAEILVLTSTIAALLHEAIAALVFVGALAVVGELSLHGLGWLLVAVPLQLALTLGLALLLAGVQVFFRDTAQLLGMVLTGWFYFTPIVYPLALVPVTVRRFLAWNPLTGLVSLYRAAFLGGPLASDGLAALVAGALALLGLGWLSFRRLRPGFADEL